MCLQPPSLRGRKRQRPGLCTHPPGGQLAYATWQSWLQSACCSETRCKWQCPRGDGSGSRHSCMARDSHELDRSSMRACCRCHPRVAGPLRVFPFHFRFKVCVPATKLAIQTQQGRPSQQVQSSCCPRKRQLTPQLQLRPVTKGSAAERMSVHMHHTCGERKAPRLEWRSSKAPSRVASVTAGTYAT